jgi:hypothetical protein
VPDAHVDRTNNTVIHCIIKVSGIRGTEEGILDACSNLQKQKPFRCFKSPARFTLNIKANRVMISRHSSPPHEHEELMYFRLPVHIPNLAFFSVEQHSLRCNLTFSFLVAQQPYTGIGRLILEVSEITHNTPHWVGLLWKSDRPVAETSTRQHTTLTTDRYPHPRRDSKSQSQRAVRAAAVQCLRPRSHWDRRNLNPF